MTLEHVQSGHRITLADDLTYSVGSTASSKLTIFASVVSMDIAPRPFPAKLSSRLYLIGLRKPWNVRERATE